MLERDATWRDIEKELKTNSYPDVNNNIVIFGGGIQGINTVPVLREELSVAAFCDNDRKKQGTVIAGLPCIAPQEISQFKKPFILISAIQYCPSISRQLSDMGLSFCTVDAYVTHKYIDSFSRVYQMLDERSRGIYAGMLLSRVSGDQKRIFGLCEDRQYFALPQFRFCGIQEVFVDCGAYTGENVQTFLNNQAGIFKKIYAFEANPAAFAAMGRRLAHEKDVWLFREEQIVCERNFVSGRDKVRIPFHITQGNPLNSYLQEDAGDVTWIETVSLDRYFERKGEETITFLKSDIEGAEWDMLHGAKNIIQRSKPKAAISIYHNIYDFFRIPLYLKELVPEYCFAIRQHWNSYDETVLYAFLPE